MLTYRTRLERLEARQERPRQPEIVCVLVGANLTEIEREVLARPDVLTVPAFGEGDHILEGFTGRVLGLPPPKPLSAATGSPRPRRNPPGRG